jgi:hypothetical protein
MWWWDVNKKMELTESGLICGQIYYDSKRRIKSSSATPYVIYSRLISIFYLLFSIINPNKYVIYPIKSINNLK